jgi:anti-sigma regulatory factor (Ser/Thr protein kinase)
MLEVKFKIPAYLGFVPIIRNAIESIAYLFSFSDKDAYELKLAFDEICNNAIEHGSKGEDKDISIECQFDNKIATITVKDSGSPEFNVEEVLKEGQRLMEEEAAKPKLDTVRRKRGLMIVKKFVDTLDITSNPNGTVVKMVKKIHDNNLEPHLKSSFLMYR